MHLPVLASDCASCSGLCCVLLPYAERDGFGATKAGGTPCHHLTGDDACAIHRTLIPDGWPGCTRFECFGAGQHVTHVTYGGASWRDQDDLGEMGAVFTVVRLLHEMLFHLRTAADRAPEPAEADVVAGLVAEIVAVDHSDPVSLLTADLDDLHHRVGDVLGRVSARVRAAHRGPGLERRDLAGRDLSRRDLRGAALRGALLIRTDLSRSDLADADLLGADLRDADVRGTRLADALFLTQPQVNGARGDAATTLPAGLARPGHWPVVART